MPKTCSQFCIAAIAAKDDREKLEELGEELRVNACSYSLVELRYMKEHIIEIIKDLARRDAAFMREFLNHLLN